MDDLVDVVDVDLAGAVARDRLLDVVDELAELGLVLGRDTLARAACRSAFDASCVKLSVRPRVAFRLLPDCRGESRAKRGGV